MMIFHRLKFQLLSSEGNWPTPSMG